MSTATYIIPPKPLATETEASPSVSPFLFLDYVRPDLDAVEACMNTDLGSDFRTVSTITKHILRAGGKRLRPAMVALAARAVQPDIATDRIAVVGSAVEFVHMATLIHDDVVDNTATRRGKPTANAIFGNGVTVLTGDYVLARSMRLLAIDGDLKIIRTVSEITIDMSEGEIMEIGATGKADLAIEEYLEILRKKTATFVEGCCRCGSILAGGDEQTETALSEYGYRLGMAFQLADDLLDYNGDPCVTGKPRGSDLKDGRATLPFMITLQEANEADRARILQTFGNNEASDSEVLEICDLLANYNAYERTRAVACRYVEEAAAALVCLPPSRAKECFQALTEFVIDRDR